MIAKEAIIEVRANRALSGKSTDGAISREEYYRLTSKARGVRDELMKKTRFGLGNRHKNIQRCKIRSRTFREVRKSDPSAYRITISMALRWEVIALGP